jgi:chromosomal replication initiation ATPase DnaA
MIDKKQLLINFNLKKDYSKEDFYVSSSNLFAFDIINSWPKWIKRSVNLSGERYSGKSHLVKIFESKTSCLSVISKDFSDTTLIKFKTKQALIIEDFNAEIPEKLLYSLFNIIEQENKYLLITSIKPLNKFNFKLNDLFSRIKNCLYVKLEVPDDELIYALIIKNFSDRQITIEKKFIDFIIKNIDRSYEKIYEFIYKIDEISLKKKKSIDFKIIKEALKV